MQTKPLPQLLNAVRKINTVIITVAISSLVLLGCSSPPPAAGPQPAPALPVAEITAASLITYENYPASIEGAVNIEIRPQVSGSLEKVFVDEGAFVSEGQPLFKINDLPYREQLNSANAQLHAAEGALINAQLEIDKLTPLVQNKVVSDYQLKVAQASYKIAKANSEQARTNVATAQIYLDYTLIKAPVSGYIGRLTKKQGSLVAPADQVALTQLSDVHEVHVYFSLSEQDFMDFKEQYAGESLNDKLKQVPAVSLILANDSSYSNPGKIDMIDGQFDKSTGAIALRAIFPNPLGLLRSGNTGKVRLGVLHTNALIVPQSATMDMQDKVFVFAVGDSNKVSKQLITIIGKNGADYLVKDGVKHGDRIVLSGLDHLQEGAVIAPQLENKKVATK